MIPLIGSSLNDSFNLKIETFHFQKYTPKLHISNWKNFRWGSHAYICNTDQASKVPSPSFFAMRLNWVVRSGESWTVWEKGWTEKWPRKRIIVIGCNQQFEMKFNFVKPFVNRPKSPCGNSSFPSNLNFQIRY